MTFENIIIAQSSGSTVIPNLIPTANSTGYALLVDSQGKLYLGAVTATVPVASSSVLGGVKVQSTSDVAVDGSGDLTLHSFAPTAVAYASSVAIAFGTSPINNVTTIGALTGALTLTTSGLAAGTSAVIILTGGGSSETLTLPSWIFLGAAAPTALAAGKTAVLSLYSTGTTDAAVVASYAVQP